MNRKYINDLKAQLTEVNKTISAIQKGGQSASFGTDGESRSVTQGDLNTLLKERQRLERIIYGGINARQAVGA